LVSKYRRWNCSKCVDRVKVSGQRPTSENVSVQQDGMNDASIHPSIHPFWMLILHILLVRLRLHQQSWRTEVASSF
jgi:hypothetical protein